MSVLVASVLIFSVLNPIVTAVTDCRTFIAQKPAAFPMDPYRFHVVRQSMAPILAVDAAHSSYTKPTIQSYFLENKPMANIDLSRLQTVHHPLHRPLLVITASEGSLCCGYISVDSLNRNGDAAAIVSGVDNHEQMLSAPIKAVSDLAVALGVEIGMTGAEALKRFGANEIVTDAAETN